MSMSLSWSNDLLNNQNCYLQPYNIFSSAAESRMVNASNTMQSPVTYMRMVTVAFCILESALVYYLVYCWCERNPRNLIVIMIGHLNSFKK